MSDDAPRVLLTLHLGDGIGTVEINPRFIAYMQNIAGYTWGTEIVMGDGKQFQVKEERSTILTLIGGLS